ncbi:MAG: CPBP family intramembrane glutamic endopeptidase [Anaerolineae bacterium]
MVDLGYPSVVAQILAFALVLIPVELGYLLYQGKRLTGRYTLHRVISYRNPVPWRQNVVSIGLTFMAIGAIFTLLKPVDAFLKERLFSWVPEPSYGLDGRYSRETLIVTHALALVFVAVLSPLVEELYFRGYLLPRMKGKSAPWVHSLLFAAQHVLTPGMIVTRTLGLMPLIFAVKRRSITTGIAVHILCNTVNVIAGIAYILRMP